MLRVVAGVLLGLLLATSGGGFAVAPARAAAGPGVVSFSTVGPFTNAAEIEYALTFDTDVSGLEAGDFSVSGSATGCTVGLLTGSGTVYSISLAGCSDGAVVLTLAAGAVRDAELADGPAAATLAPSVTVDRGAPTTSAPGTRLRTGARVEGWQVPVTFTWTGSDGTGSGIARYEVERSADEGASWEDPIPVAAPTQASWVWGLGTTVVRVRAVDAAGNVGPWSTSTSMAPSLVQQTAFSYKGWWKFFLDGRYSGGCAKKSSSAGSWMKYRFTGRTVGIVTTVGPARGKVRVYLDGVLRKTLNLHATTTRHRVQVWTYRWSSSGAHTIKIVAVGTAGHPRFDADAITVIN